MPMEVLHFFVTVVEVLAAIAGILLAGLLVAMAAMWILTKSLGVTPEPLDDYESPEVAEVPEKDSETVH